MQLLWFVEHAFAPYVWTSIVLISPTIFCSRLTDPGHGFSLICSPPCDYTSIEGSDDKAGNLTLTRNPTRSASCSNNNRNNNNPSFDNFNGNLIASHGSCLFTDKLLQCDEVRSTVFLFFPIIEMSSLLRLWYIDARRIAFVLRVAGTGIGIRRTRAGSYRWTMVLRRATHRGSDTKYRRKLANVLLQNPPWTDSGFPRVNFCKCKPSADDLSERKKETRESA